MSSPRQQAPFADNPSQGLIPLSITPLCLNRMIGWATIVNHLIRYLTIVVGEFGSLLSTRQHLIISTSLDQEKKISESLAKTSKDLADALTSDNLELFAEG